ncbi:hypothetical protein [Bacillus velezensis]|uniref:hypothetical protein n=1 Tax=Bacillus TaxID=1386 RepID=UPI00039F5194|nr:hypothetical protein [Bacillus velezensis]MCA1232035.1 hypothetical protein [Bacillus velezensis]MCA1310275.1 hypothetical protein [Bacillus velezensis]MCA1329313.1 hypothetical protein [Bacillus velezensis]MCE4941123.1 hypothetical protein [Bacillus velezensis]MCM3278818.1 hypothetical protein [Bacillus velezensis]
MEDTTIFLEDLLVQDSGLAYELLLMQAKYEELKKENAQLAYEMMTTTTGGA